jgi:hypothetical protein
MDGVPLPAADDDVRNSKSLLCLRVCSLKVLGFSEIVGDAVNTKTLGLGEVDGEAVGIELTVGEEDEAMAFLCLGANCVSLDNDTNLR